MLRRQIGYVRYCLFALAFVAGCGGEVIDGGAASSALSSPSKLAFLSPAQSVAVKTCSAEVSVGILDSNLEQTEAVHNTIIYPTGNLSFYQDAKCTTKISSLEIAGGSKVDTAGFYFESPTTGAFPITITSSGLSSDIQDEGVGEAVPTPKPTSFRMPATFSTPAGSCSAPITFETMSGTTVAAVGASTFVNISNNPGSVKAYSDAGCTKVITALTLEKGASQGTFYLEGTSAGVADLVRIFASGFETASATYDIGEAVLPPAPVSAGPGAAPAQAAAAGFTNLVFDDEFTSADTISVGTGTASTNWYTHSYTGVTLPPADYSVQGGYLTINSDTSGYSDGLNTATTGHTDGAWQHAYFEAAIRFNPKGHTSGAWPAFWSYSLDYFVNGNQNADHVELDFMEAYPTGSSITYITTIHDWMGQTANGQNSNNVPTVPASTDYTQFHRYGCLWTPGKVVWYFDDEPVTTVATGAGTLYDSMETDKMAVLLGTGVSWPMDVDYVRIWQ
jgi:beta-glucanase (GH16 family)